MLLSVVVPCHNEENNVAVVWASLVDVLEPAAIDFEVVFVDDGSKDATLLRLRALAEADRRVRYVSFSRNFGKEAAMLAGLQAADGDVSVIMDGDGQHPASLVPEMLLKYREGYDQVVARRTRAGDPRSRRLSAKIYYRLINRFIEVRLDDGIGDFRLLSRRAVDSLLSMPEYNRFSKGLFSWIGFPTAVVDYVNVRRLEGQPKWGFRRLLDYGIDGVLSFNSKPLRLAVWVGLTVTSLSLAYVAWLIGVAIVRGVESPGYVTLITSVLILGGLQLIAIGVIGEYIGRIYFEVKRRPAFLVKEATTPLRDVQRDRDHQVDGG